MEININNFNFNNINNFSKTSLPKAQDIKLNIIFEDNNIIIINKQANLSVHPSNSEPENTLVNALVYYYKNNLSDYTGDLNRPGIIHRLDKNTTGLIIIAKNNYAHKKLASQLADRSLSRVYFALVHGKLKESNGIISANIGRNPKDRKKMAVLDENITNKKSRQAITEWEKLEEFKNSSLVKIKLHTGRTHQIRVHFSYINHPLVGDPVYGNPKLDKFLFNSNNISKNNFIYRQCLHAGEIKFIHPETDELMSFSCDLAEDFQNLLNNLKINNIN